MLQIKLILLRILKRLRIILPEMDYKSLNFRKCQTPDFVTYPRFSYNSVFFPKRGKICTEPFVLLLKIILLACTLGWCGVRQALDMENLIVLDRAFSS